MHNLFRYSALLLSILLVSPLTSIFVFAQDEGGEGEFSYEFESGLELNEEDGNCAVPVTSLNGQGYSVSGVTGGLTTGPLIGRYAADPRTLFAPTTSGRDAVAILVIDEFTTPVTNGYQILPQIFNRTSDLDLETDVDGGYFPHGAQVFNHIIALLEGALFSEGYVPNQTSDRVVWINDQGDTDPTNDSQVAVKMVDALQYGTINRTITVRDAIADAIVQLYGEGFTDFVLNMSFAVIPCDVVEHYQAARINFPSFEDYSLEVQRQYGYFLDQLVAPLQPDLLQDLSIVCPGSDIEGNVMEPQAEIVDEDFYGNEVVEICQANSGGVWYVASAGNFTLPYQFFPAALDEVIGVSATQNGRRASYSNYNADTSLIGGWFQLVDPQDINGGFGAADVFYRGTSFSGPVQSVCIALDVTTADPACQSFMYP